MPEIQLTKLACCTGVRTGYSVQSYYQAVAHIIKMHTLTCSNGYTLFILMLGS